MIKEKMKRIYIIISLCTSLLLSELTLWGQKYTLSGYVECAESGEKISGAVIHLKNDIESACMTNVYGFYSLSVDAKEIELQVDYIGYAPQQLQLYLDKDTILNFSLHEANEIEEVRVYGEKTEAQKTAMGQMSIPVKTIKNIPVFMGEVDVLKAVQLLPGIKSGTEGTGGFYVRGGSADQNLILIDGVPVYNANHLFGFFSVFNADAISNVNITKGGFPARYGGRLSSVLDIRMKEGNTKKFAGAVSIGLISSKFMFEGPIVKDKTSFILSARRTYIDILSYPFQKLLQRTEDGLDILGGYYFWDINAKVNHTFSNKHRIFLSVYTGRDKAYMKEKYDSGDFIEKSRSKLYWGNITSAFRWNYMMGSKLFMNTTATYSRYKFGVGMWEQSKDMLHDNDSEFEFDYTSGIIDYALKADFDYSGISQNTVKFGANCIHHTFRPGVEAVKIEDGYAQSSLDTTRGDADIFALEYALYAEDEFNLFQGLKLNLGVHYSGFYVDKTWYQSLQPRVLLRYLISPQWSLKAAYTRMTQYLHLLTNSTIGLPTDLWLPVTQKVKPQQSSQYALGGAYSFAGFDISLESYYKDMSHLIEYKEGASFFDGVAETDSSGRSWEKRIETDGKGVSYGIELLIRKNTGNLTGWFGYTLSKTERQFPNVSFGEWFPYTYDKRHDLSLVLTYKFNEKVDVGLTWVFSTGNAVTMAFEKYQGLKHTGGDNYNGNVINHIEKRNNYRMPSYHRLDLGVNLHKEKKYGKRTWSFGVYNAYNRKNPFFLQMGRDNNGNPALYKYSLFSIIPSFSYKYQFSINRNK